MLTLDEILKATTFADLFAEGTKKELRKLLKNTHPDLHPNDKAKAEKAFVHVNTIWALKDKPSGTKHTDAKETLREDTILTKKHEYTVKLRRTANGVNTYDAVYDGVQKANLLIATHPKIGAALLDGTRNLKQIKTNIPDQYLEFFPETLDAFHIPQPNGQKLSGVAQPSTKTFYSLREVIEDYPKGIDQKDVAWMYRRMLVAIGNTHDAGFAHGAPNLDAFLIEPETHALVLTNWQFSKELDQNINMVTPDLKEFYETDREMTKKKDLRILSDAAFQLLHPGSTKRIRAFFNGMRRYPTNDARAALGEFDALLKELWGERDFHAFRMRRPPVQ